MSVSIRAMQTIQDAAARRVAERPTTTRSGWKFVAVMPGVPWQWVLAERDKSLARFSPRMFLEACDE